MIFLVGSEKQKRQTKRNKMKIMMICYLDHFFALFFFRKSLSSTIIHSFIIHHNVCFTWNLPETFFEYIIYYYAHNLQKQKNN